MQRVIQPELLDMLPHDDPDAMRAREEMVQVNELMGNHRWIERMVRWHGSIDWRITELGAGDGVLALRLINGGTCRAESLHALDLKPRPIDWPEKAQWTCGDLLRCNLPESEVVVANLFLHHFTAQELAQLGSRLSRATRLIVAAEPARFAIFRVFGRIFCELAELNHVQRHDLRASVRAGFRGQELRESLGLGPEWHVEAHYHPMGGYRFVAMR